MLPVWYVDRLVCERILRSKWPFETGSTFEESEGHDPYARRHAQLSRLARRQRLFTLQGRKTEVTIPKPEGSGRVQGGARSVPSSSSMRLQVVRESNPHKQIWSLLS